MRIVRIIYVWKKNREFLDEFYNGYMNVRDNYVKNLSAQYCIVSNRTTIKVSYRLPALMPVRQFSQTVYSKFYEVCAACI